MNAHRLDRSFTNIFCLNAFVWRLLLLVFLTLGSISAQAALEVGRLGEFPVSLTQELSFLEDASRQLSLSDLQQDEAKNRFRHHDAPAYAIQLGVTKNPWWLKFSLRNDTDLPLERYIEIANSRLTRLTFYQPDANLNFQSIQTGSLTPFGTRPYPNRNFVFPVTLAPRSTATYYIRVESSSAMTIPARVWQPNAFRQYEQTDHLEQGWYLGMVTAMALFNMFLYIALRQNLYLVYFGVVTSIAFTSFSHNGLIKKLIAADSPAWSLSSASVGYAISVGLLLLFMRQILSTPTMLPRVDRLLRLLMWVYLLPVPIALASFHQSVIYPVQFLTFAVIVVELLVGLYLCLLRQRSAYFFMLAYSVLIFVACLNLLAGIGIIMLPWDAGWSLQVASAFEMLLLSLALADRMSEIRRQRDRSQELAVQLQAQLVDELRSSEQRLKKLVSQRVDELRKLIDMLSHEIRTPMSVIRMYLSMDQPSSRSQAQAQQAIHDVDAIIERCLEADLIDHGSVAIHRQRCPVDAVVKGLASSNLETRRISVAVDQACEVQTDVQLLKILLSNLIDNALKYSPFDAVVEILVQPADVQHQAGVSVRVSNPVGTAGYPDPEQLFRKFYRSPAAHGKSGSGLGLYLVRQFVQLLNGTIDYQQRDGKVIFELWLPCAS